LRFHKLIINIVARALTPHACTAAKQAPLIIGSDIRHASDDVIKILGNKEAIRINQVSGTLYVASVDLMLLLHAHH
jgi:hypothetical protein